MSPKKAAAKSVPRARADADTIEQQVQAIMSMMALGEWQAGKSHRELAERWGVSVVVVEKRAAEAGRAVRRAVDPEAVTGQSLAALERVLRLAFERQGYTMTGEPYDNPDLERAIKAIATRAQLLGLVTQKHDITQSDGWAKLPDDEKRMRLEAYERAIASERSRLGLPAKGETR